METKRRPFDRWRRVQQLLSFLIAICVVSACGSGGKDSQTSDAGTPPGTTGQDRKIIVTLAPSLPAGVGDSISSIVSARGTAAPGSPLPIPPLASEQDHIVFAVKGNSPYLAAFTKGDVVLNTETTAVAMVRIAMGAAHLKGIDPNTFSSQAAQAPSFASLVAEVNAALASGTAPTGSTKVIAATKAVAAEVAQALAPKASLLATISSNADFPYYFYNNGARDRIWLTNASANKLVFNNQSAIFWRVTTNPSDGTSVVLADPRSTTLWQLGGDYGGSASQTEITGASPRFTITVDLGGKAREYNGMLVLSRLFVTGIALIGADVTGTGLSQCGLQFTTQFMNDKLPALIDQETPEAFKDYLISHAGLSSVDDYANTLFSYATACAGLQAEGRLLLPRLFSAAALEFIAPLQLTATTINAIDSMDQLRQYYTQSFSVDVCKRNGDVVPCELSLKITPPAATIEVNETVSLSAQLYDVKGNPYPSTSGINWSSNNTAVASVDPTGVVTGISSGPAIITATDPGSLATATATITVGSCTPKFNGISFEARPDVGDIGIFYSFSCITTSLPVTTTTTYSYDTSAGPTTVSSTGSGFIPIAAISGPLSSQRYVAGGFSTEGFLTYSVTSTITLPNGETVTRSASH